MEKPWAGGFMKLRLKMLNQEWFTT